MSEIHDGCALGIKNEQRIIALDIAVNKIEISIKDMRDNLMQRPSWSVTIIITILSSTTVAAIVFALGVLKHGG